MLLFILLLANYPYLRKSGFRMLAGAARKIEQAMGDGKLGYLEREIPIAENLRQHLSWEASELK